MNLIEMNEVSVVLTKSVKLISKTQSIPSKNQMSLIYLMRIDEIFESWAAFSYFSSSISLAAAPSI